MPFFVSLTTYLNILDLGFDLYPLRFNLFAQGGEQYFVTSTLEAEAGEIYLEILFQSKTS